jgi:hypothetical protein
MAALLASGVAGAYKDAPPKGLVLDGTWVLDPARSDDAQAVMQKTQDDMRSQREQRAAGRDRGMGGGEGGWGRGGGGRRGHHQDDAGGEDSDNNRPNKATKQRGAGALIADLAANPDHLTITTAERTLTVTAAGHELDCEPGEPIAIEDGAGSAERRCGWQGRAWVLETKRARNGSRTDRYELSRDGRTLTYTTDLSIPRWAKIHLQRVYTLAPAVAARPGP